MFNLHTPHTRDGVARSSATFRRLIDLAVERGGSYYLTYHRWAEAHQVLACYPQFADFLALKRHHDPDELFHSDWYQHHTALFPAAVDPGDGACGHDVPDPATRDQWAAARAAGSVSAPV